MSFYPNQLEPLFAKLLSCGVEPVIVGGFVRDRLFGLDEVKDIDVELYGVKDFASLETMVCEFGKVKSFGKSFGVCHLVLDTFEIDFSLPRLENKNGFGHKDFLVTIAPDIDFKRASARRDFTINAIGYALSSDSFLDPHGGIDDLRAKVLREVDSTKFQEDPLRVLRCARFYAKYDLEMAPSLKALCAEMVLRGELDFLPKERIFEELLRLVELPSPVKGLRFLRELGAKFVGRWYEKLEYLTQDENRILLSFACLFYGTDEVKKIVSDKKLLAQIELLSDGVERVERLRSELEVGLLALQVNIWQLLSFYKALYGKTKAHDMVMKLAQNCGVLHKAKEPLLQGRDLVELGLKPSKEFSHILQKAYEAQLNSEFDDIEKAKKWVEEFIDNSK